MLWLQIACIIKAGIKNKTFKRIVGFGQTAMKEFRRV